MWYVIQTRSGEESGIKDYIESIAEPSLCRVILPLREDVWRKGGIGHISVKKLFPGYLFIETEDPEEVYQKLKKVTHFTRLLSMEEKDCSKTFLTVGQEDEEFIRSLTDDGMMGISYIRKKPGGRIEEIKGPLSRYTNKITKLDIPHRRAVVETDAFGKHRKIKYSLWTDADPHLARFDAGGGSMTAGSNPVNYDIGIHEGDIVTDETGIYVDMEFKVNRVDPVRRIIHAKAELLGTTVSFELDADSVAVKR